MENYTTPTDMENYNTHRYGELHDIHRYGEIHSTHRYGELHNTHRYTIPTDMENYTTPTDMEKYTTLTDMENYTTPTDMKNYPMPRNRALATPRPIQYSKDCYWLGVTLKGSTSIHMPPTHQPVPHFTQSIARSHPPWQLLDTGSLWCSHHEPPAPHSQW